ncbi:MAG: ATP-binding cassette domain-containing protein [Alphaproteobacteria bacterium]|nr:ATP-binding cassette domain-containing protein [Alphaproteobacteria bacterium]MBX9977194.1 ATP-binding cassette domain-containing protein [Alphaproteobacteria bacterium]
MVRFDNVSLRYGEGYPVFRSLNFSFSAGSFYFLTGASGVGKTSLLKLIYRELQPTEGAVTVFSRDLSTLTQAELPHFRQRMGLVFQDCRLIDTLNVLDNVCLSLRILGTAHKRAKIYAHELLEWVGLSTHLYEYPSSLSDGQKQRVAIARAVITRPLMLLADEPTGNVDETAAFKLMYLFEELNKMGTTVILATHNRAIVNEFAYPELMLDRGHLELVSGGGRHAF